MLFSLVSEQTVLFLKRCSIGWHASGASHCCLLLWQYALEAKDEVVCCNARSCASAQVTPSLKETIVKKKKKCNRYQQIFLTFCFNSRSSFHLISQHTFYCVFFSDHFFSPSPHAAADRILQVMVVAICSLCSFFLTLFNDRVDQLIRCSPIIYLQSLLSIQMTVNTGVSAKGPKYEGTKHGNCSLQRKSR